MYYLTGEFLVEPVDQCTSQLVTGLADILPPGGEMPLIAYFDTVLTYPVQVRFIPGTAFQAEFTCRTGISHRKYSGPTRTQRPVGQCQRYGQSDR